MFSEAFPFGAETCIEAIMYQWNAHLILYLFQNLGIF